MDYLEAIKDLAREIILDIHRVFVEDRLDDTEYVRNIKSVMEGIKRFQQNNGVPEENSQKMLYELYDFAKTLWLNEPLKEHVVESEIEDQEIDEGYDEFYYDHVYEHQTYPL